MSLKPFVLCMALLSSSLLNPYTSSAQVIYEVKTNDSLYSISREFNIPLNTISTLNGLAIDTHLVQGQALVLPGKTYIVQPGESLWEISRRNSVDEKVLISLNGLKSPFITSGQRLQIPEPPRMQIWTGNFLIPQSSSANQWLLENSKDFLSAVSIFSYQTNRQGTVIDINENGAHKQAWKTGIVPYATLTNLSEKGFDPELTHHLISKPVLRSKLIENIYGLLNRHDYKGVVIDFEQVRPDDRNLLNRFIHELTSRLHPNGMSVVMAVPPKQGDYSPSYFSGYDYKTLGKYLDGMFLMTYNWHWSGGPSGPISPIDKIRNTIQYAVSIVPRSKLILGIPQYAYDWKITGSQLKATAYSTQHAIDLYTGYQSPIHFDTLAVAPWFRYKDPQGVIHEVWFEDPRSYLAKLHLVREYRLAGIGGWHLGLAVPQAGKMMLEEFTIRKSRK
jgi:spore germination protein